MIVISDNDVLKKLACCDLYQEFLRAFKATHREVVILNTAKAVLTKKPSSPLNKSHHAA